VSFLHNSPPVSPYLSSFIHGAIGLFDYLRFSDNKKLIAHHFRFIRHFQLSLLLKIFKGRNAEVPISFKPEKHIRGLAFSQWKETPTCRDNSLLKDEISKHI
jgi:hypothetical protein